MTQQQIKDEIQMWEHDKLTAQGELQYLYDNNEDNRYQSQIISLETEISDYNDLIQKLKTQLI